MKGWRHADDNGVDGDSSIIALATHILPTPRPWVSRLLDVERNMYVDTDEEAFAALRAGGIRVCIFSAD